MDHSLCTDRLLKDSLLASKGLALLSKPAINICGHVFMSVDTIAEATLLKNAVSSQDVLHAKILINIGNVHFIGNGGASLHALLQNINHKPGK